MNSKYGLCKRVIKFALLGLFGLLPACGGGGGGAAPAPTPAASYTVGGSAAGLVGSVVLQDNGGDNFTVSGNGTFTFATPVTSGSAYSVTVLTQPVGQTCSVSTGTGTISANVTNVAVVCATNSYNVGGSATGLAGTVVLQDNGGDNLTLAANGTFTFASKVANGSPYSVTVFAQPAGQTCTITSGTGTIAANVGNVAVACVNNPTIGGSVTGMVGSIVLQDNGGDNLTVAANGTFTFATKVAVGGAYNVTLFTQPVGQTCTVTGGTGTATANVTNVSVACTNNSYTIGGSVTGLTGSVVLQDNGGNNLTVAANGTFTFATMIVNGNTYSVTVLTQPVGQICTLSTGAGTVSANNVSNVAVVCATATYTVGGNATGLTGSMVLQDNLGDNLSVAASGAFTFATQVASGSPYSVTILTQPAGQSCSVASGTGTISANVTNVTITCTTNTYTIGGTVTGLNGNMVLQDNGADNLTVATNGAFQFATVVPYGNTYNVTQLSLQFVNQTCTITGGSGTVLANVTNVAMNCVKNTAPRYAFTANSIDNSVSTYVVDSTTGRLKYIGKTATGAGPTSVTIDPSGKYAYVGNGSGASVSEYAIGANGTLASIGTAGAGFIDSVTVDPSGRYAYAANSGSNSIVQFTIDANGVLTGMTPFTAPAGMSPISVTVDPAGKYAYAANSGDGTVSQYTIGAGGALTPMVPSATIAAGLNPNSVTIDPTGKYAYVANSSDGTVSQYNIGAGGALVAMATAAATAGGLPKSVTVDPSGQYAYVANWTLGIAQFKIGVGGVLTPMVPATVAAGNGAISVTVDPSGKYAYVTNSVNSLGGNSVSQYTIGAGGALTAMATATVADMASPISIAVSSGTAPVQAVPLYAYVTNSFNSTGGNTVSQYNIGTGGALAAMNPATIQTGGTQPYSVTVDPTGRYAYVANLGGGNVAQYNINADGTLTPMTTATVLAGNAPASIAVDPAGRYAYVANSNSSTVSQYIIGKDGGLSPMATATVTTGTSPWVVIVDPSGLYVYVVANGSVWQYTIGTNGALVPMATASVVSGLQSFSMSIDPSGKYAYVASHGGGNVAQFNIGAGGALAAMTPVATVTAGSGPWSVAVDPTGKYVYVANNTGGNISQFNITAGGALAAMNPATIPSGSLPEHVVVDPSGKYAYAANYNGSNISQYSIGSGGALTSMTPVATVPSGTYPSSVTTTGTWK